MPPDADLTPLAGRIAAAKQDSRMPAELPAALVIGLYEHAVECYPEECCGLLIGPAAGPPQRQVRCRNVQSRRRSRGESDLDARHAFWIDEQELLDSLVEADTAGEALRGIYHSHVDGEAYLSHTDVDCALGPDGLPLYPGVSQLVVSVWDDGVRDLACFDWDEAARAFVGRGVRKVDA
ncbi:MAG: M67 family metallopeptidase [Deltaproteobacteria bacterium]|nr:M67 family metallopeptidase [Deltaproteobacteria bacterium]